MIPKTIDIVIKERKEDEAARRIRARYFMMRYIETGDDVSLRLAHNYANLARIAREDIERMQFMIGRQ